MKDKIPDDAVKNTSCDDGAAIDGSGLETTVDSLYQAISDIVEDARKTVYRATNQAMMRAYWEIGRVIVEEEQEGREKAAYGKGIIRDLSLRLSFVYGQGFSPRNLWFMRNFYIAYPKVNALRSELSWTHYRLLMRVRNEEARSFYLIESCKNGWSTRELDRQISSLLFERLSLSRDKEKALELSREGQIVASAEDLIKDPYILEFLGMSESPDFHEKDLEQNLIDRLQSFLLELGRGFALVARQKRITVGGDHYYIDLVFYNHALKCFVLIDLKIGKLDHRDIGQMDFYVRYFEKEERSEGDNPTIGLILCSHKNEAMVRYTLLDDREQVFASKYRLCLPTEEELKREISEERARLELVKREGG
ncbi:MAG: PDDEXK nuclease domain-containing protein [Thermoleophilia bacterium]